jgi:magnesium chelatase family protein
MDRIDICVTVDTVEHDKLLTHHSDQKSADKMKQLVATARNCQAKRYGNGQKLNAAMSNQDIKQHAQLSPAAKQLLDMAAQRLDISARSYMRSLKVARTIADLENSTTIEPVHVSEALQYRGQTSRET